MKILITGACGMLGSHMVDHFYRSEHEILGTFYKPTIDLAEVLFMANYIECDVRYYHRVNELISTFLPDIIFHLAAQSFPTISWERPQETLDTNVTGTINVFESIKSIRKQFPSFNPTVVVACSSAEYGASITPDNIPIKEDTALLPLHPYGVSKVAQDLLAYQYFRNDNIKAIRARIFNSTGPRKINDAPSDFVRRVVNLNKSSEKKTLNVGNLESYRAITDVRDLVMAMILLAQKGISGDVYNISGSKVYQMQEIVSLIQKSTSFHFELIKDENLFRPNDEPIILGDSTKFIAQTGWSQKIPLEKTLTDMILYWEKKHC